MFLFDRIKINALFQNLGYRIDEKHSKICYPCFFFVVKNSFQKMTRYHCNPNIKTCFLEFNQLQRM